MKRVLRYDLVIDDQPHEVPRGIPVLFTRSAVHAEGWTADRVDVWFEVPTPDDWPVSDHTMGTQRVQIVGTGDPVPGSWRWLASMKDGRFIRHLYEVRP